MAEFEKTKPSDAVQWVLDITPPEKLGDLNLLVLRLLHILVSAVHTSSVTFLNTLYYLAKHPETHDELRQEIIEVFASENGEWKKQGLTDQIGEARQFPQGNCSFPSIHSRYDNRQSPSSLKKRFSAYSDHLGTMDRIAMKDYTLKDGTFIPKGTYVLVPASATNLDTDVWGPDADKFDPWRFAKMRQAPGQETHHSLVQTTPQFTYFGHGKHACPGRFFAANELKVLLVYTLMNYVVKMPPGASELRLQWSSGKTMPDMQAHVMWKARKAVKMPWKDLSELGI
ncbi:cytochrome P450 [Aspergillus navahoensis]